jgi:serine protease AprX
VGVEVVAGTPAAIRSLAANPRVAGISPDDRLVLTGREERKGRLEDGVFAWSGLDDKTGRGQAGAGVTVALVDTGVSDTPALNRASARLVDGVDTSRLGNTGEAPTSGVFSDGYGHGTFMANLIAGGPIDQVPGKRALGVAPGARVVVVKVADDQGVTSLSQVLAGLDWVAAQAPKIQVVNIALAHARPQNAYGADPLTAAVEHLTKGGLIVVAAAGNTRGEIGDPGLAPQALTVGAADVTTDKAEREPRVAPFTGSGVVAGVRKPDLVASGVDLLSLLPPQSLVARRNPSSLQRNGLYRGSGTSESTAVTSGAVATLLSNHPDARLSQVKPALRLAADRIDGGPAQGQGLLDLTGALRELRQYDGADASGEAAFDSQSWQASSWYGGSWAAWLADAWTANPWAADGSWSTRSWSLNTWNDDDWSASSWSASSWAASSWAASSWAASSWAAGSWAAGSWAAGSWAANSWAAGSWAAGSWASQNWGGDG